ncbi:hypothetical protein M2282_002282 [Variovorax boronicumulans]|uniref:TniQ family protein n=1 Tax=Variovorax boronicumulans TaxID=436515 RepID=UPI002473FC84|nr:TniQ family protein [Variovorax boronicumulans]MDH6167133.1 hypothetical protein [Variovorax boronicumulans]
MTESTTFTEFPVRPLPREGESAAGYCWRFFDANGHTAPAAARAAARSDLPVDRKINAMVGPHVIDRLRSAERDRLTWQGSLPPANWFARSRMPRFCSVCIAELGYHLAVWDMPLATACGVHGCRLLSRCPGCSASLSWSTLGSGWRCTCKAAMSTVIPVRAHRWEVIFSRFLAGASDSNAPVGLRRRAAREPTTRCQYRTRDLYGFLVYLLSARRYVRNGGDRSMDAAWSELRRYGERTAPSRPEVTLLSTLSPSLQVKAGRFMRRLCRHSVETLIDMDDDLRFTPMLDALQSLSAAGNPFAGTALRTVSECWRSSRIGIPSLETVCFNPQLRLDERVAILDRFNRWWAGFVAEIQPRDPADCFADDPSDEEAWLLVLDPRHHAVSILNVFLDVASGKRSHDGLLQLIRRWHPSEELRRSGATLQSVGAYLTTLSLRELAFVDALMSAPMSSNGPPAERPNHG